MSHDVHFRTRFSDVSPIGRLDAGIAQQARLVGVVRSSVYYRAHPVSRADQLLTRRIDELHMAFPFASARMLARQLRRDGHEVARRRVCTLMKGIDASRFVQGAVHVTDRRIVVGGLRLLMYSQLAGKGHPFQLNTNRSDSKWLPRAGVIDKATDCLSQHGSYSASLKPMSTIAPMSSGVVIDSNVEPEHAKSYEVGAKFDTRFKLLAYFVASVFATYDTKTGRHPVHYPLNVKNVFNKTYYPSSASQHFVAIGDARSATL
ncbi:hypothetical protein LMG16407_01654 [Pandoraea apista]|nr:hypothetical protein AT395_17035 [Pandoraea apista]CFB61589.1 hypothetical protein LMG16407_01654 [Pandoraea apista]